MNLTPEQTNKIEKKLTDWEARLTTLEQRARQTPEEAGAAAGAESGIGSEESMARDNRRLSKALNNSRFAAAYFATQRLTFQAKKRFGQGLPQRRLSK